MSRNRVCGNDGRCGEPAVYESDADCDAGRVCTEDECTDGCGGDRPCPGTQVCVADTGLCEEGPNCNHDDDCLEARICTNGACDDPCIDENDCPGTRECAVDGHCPEPDVCQVAEDCDAGRVCENGACGMPVRSVAVQVRCSAMNTGICEELSPCAADEQCFETEYACWSMWRALCQRRRLPRSTGLRHFGPLR